MVNLIKRDPFQNLISWPHWFDEIDELSSQKGLRVYENDKDIIAEAVVAGIPAKDIEIHIEDGILKIKAEKSEEKKSKDEYKSSSRQYYYTCALSGGQWDKADAEVEDGIVKITIPKTKAARPRKIRVKTKEKK